MMHQAANVFSVLKDQKFLRKFQMQIMCYKLAPLKKEIIKNFWDSYETGFWHFLVDFPFNIILMMMMIIIIIKKMGGKRHV